MFATGKKQVMFLYSKKMLRKNRQLEKLSLEKNFFGRVVANAKKKKNVFSSGVRTAVFKTRLLKRQRVLKVCKTEIDALREFFAAKELRKIFHSAIKNKIIEPKNYFLAFSKISLVKGRVLVIKEEPGILLHSVFFEKSPESLSFLSKHNISSEEIRDAFGTLKKDLEKVFSSYSKFLDIKDGNNIILKGKKGKVLEFVLIDQPKSFD